MLQELLFLFGLAALPAAFSFFLDFALGKPGSNEPNSQAIFFEYTYSLALGRLRKEDRLGDLLKAMEPLLSSEDKKQRRDGTRQFKIAVVLSAQPYFTWEQAVGACLYCTNFWVSLFASTIFFFTVPLQLFPALSYFVFIPIISHLILRKL